MDLLNTMDAFFLEPSSEEEKIDLARSTKKIKLCDGMAKKAVAHLLENDSESGMAVEYKRKSSFKNVL